MSNNESRKRARAKQAAVMLTGLRAHYPTLFDPEAPVPLAVGIHVEIQAAFPMAPHNAIRGTLRRWTRRDEYRAALLVEGARRRHLDGSDAGEVTDAERAFAGEAVTC